VHGRINELLEICRPSRVAVRIATVAVQRLDRDWKIRGNARRTLVNPVIDGKTGGMTFVP
jgi:hypothetical protein